MIDFRLLLTHPSLNTDSKDKKQLFT
jgi:hypothetical protein